MEPNEIPITDAALGEVVARVAFRIIERDYRHCPVRYAQPVDGMYSLAVRLSDLDYVALSAFVAAYAREKKRNPTSTLRFIRSAFLERSRQRPGATWRSVAFSEYKEPRRSW